MKRFSTILILVGIILIFVGVYQENMYIPLGGLLVFILGVKSLSRSQNVD